MSNQHIESFIDELRQCVSLHAFDRAFLTALTHLFNCYPDTSSSINTTSSSLFSSDSAKSLSDSDLSSDSDNDDFNSDDYQVPFLADKALSIEHIDWLQVFAHRWKAIADDIRYSYTFNLNVYANKVWIKLLFAYVKYLPQYTHLNFIKILIPIKNNREPTTLRPLIDYFVCTLYRFDSMPQRNKSSKSFINTWILVDNKFTYIDASYSYHSVIIDPISQSEFLQEILDLFEDKFETNVPLEQLFSIIAKYGWMLPLDMLNFYLDSNNQVLHYLPATLDICENKNFKDKRFSFATFVDYRHKRMKPMAPLDIYRIRDKVTPASNEDKKYCDMSAYISNRFVAEDIILCSELPEANLQSDIVYLSAEENRFIYRIHHKMTTNSGEIFYSELSTSLTFPITLDKVNDCYWEIEILLSLRGHITGVPVHPIHLFPALLRIVDDYFNIAEDDKTIALKQFRRNFSIWGKFLRSSSINKVNFFYAEKLKIDTDETYYIFDVLPEFFRQEIVDFDKKLLALVKFIIGIDAEFALICKSTQLLDYFVSLEIEIGKTFSIGALKQIITEKLLPTSRGETRKKLSELLVYLISAEVIDTKILYLIQEIYVERRRQIPQSYRYPEGNDYWWIRTAQLLAHYLPYNYQRLLMPELKAASLIKLAQYRMHHGFLYFELNGKTYATFEHGLERPILTAFQIHVQIPRHLIYQLPQMITSFLSSTHDECALLAVKQQLSFWMHFVNETDNYDDVYYLYSQRIQYLQSHIYFADVMVDLYEWTIQQKKYDEIKEKIIALALWLNDYDFSFICNHPDLAHVYAKRGISSVFDAEQLLFQLDTLIPQCSDINQSAIQCLMAKVKEVNQITPQILIELCRIFKTQREDNLTRGLSDYWAMVEPDNWIRLAQILQGASYFEPYTITVLNESALPNDIERKTIYIKQIDWKLQCWFKDITGKTTHRHIPQSVINLNFLLSNNYQFYPYVNALFYFLSEQEEIMPQNYYSLLYWPINQDFDHIRYTSILELSLSDYIPCDNQQTLICLRSCYEQFLANGTFTYHNREPKALSQHETELALQTRYAYFIEQAQFLSLSKPLDFEMALATYYLANEACYPRGLIEGSSNEYSPQQFGVAARAFHNFIEYYRHLPDEMRERFNKKRINYYNTLRSGEEILNRSHRERFCMALVSFQCAMFAVSSGPFKFRHELEHNENFMRERNANSRQAGFYSFNAVAKRAYMLFVDLLTRQFEDEAKHPLKPQFFWDKQNGLNRIACRMYKELQKTLDITDEKQISDIYVGKIISQIITPALYDNCITLNRRDKYWLQSILNDNLFQLRNFYEPVVLLSVLTPLAFSQNNYAPKLQMFIDEMLQTCLQAQSDLNRKIRINIKLVELLSYSVFKPNCEFACLNALPDATYRNKYSTYLWFDSCNLVFARPECLELSKYTKPTVIVTKDKCYLYTSDMGLELLPLHAREVELIVIKFSKVNIDSKKINAGLTKEEYKQLFNLCERNSANPLNETDYTMLLELLGNVARIQSLYFYAESTNSLEKLNLGAEQIEAVREFFTKKNGLLTDIELKRLTLITGHTPFMCQQIWYKLDNASNLALSESNFLALVANYLHKRMLQFDEQGGTSLFTLFTPAQRSPVSLLEELRAKGSLIMMLAHLQLMVTRMDCVLKEERLQFLSKYMEPIPELNVRQDLGRRSTY